MTMKNKNYRPITPVMYKLILTALLTLVLTQCGLAYSPQMRRARVQGPWELLIQVGFEGQKLGFPVKVDNEDKSQKLDASFPVLATPIKVKLVRYVPNLNWTTSAADDPNGDIIVNLAITGEDLNQDLWLVAADPAQQSVSSSIGGIELKKLHDAKHIEKLLQELKDPNAIGVITVWTDNAAPPSEYVVHRSETIAIQQSKYKVKVLDFLPHYSIDTETKEVVNQSDKPLNPAIKISLIDGENETEQWLWSKFPSSPHSKNIIPLRIEFTHFDPNIAKGQYILATANKAEPWLFFTKEKKLQLEKAAVGKPYLFSDENYSFTIKKVFGKAAMKTEWANKSEELHNPALIALIEENGTEKEVVLEFNKPSHHKSSFGTMILLYRHLTAQEKPQHLK